MNDKKILYLNCGDWVEHFSAVEYYDKNWHLLYFDEPDDEMQTDEPDIPEKKQLYKSLYKEFVCT